MLVDTGQGGDTVRVDHTLWTAATVWVTKVLRSAATDTGAAADPGISIGSTRIGIAGIFNFNRFNDKWRLATCCEGVSNVSLEADTVGDMIDHLALCIHSTIGCWTGVNTMQVLTCFAGWTFCICGTFRPAGNIGVSKVIWDTLTCSCSSLILTNSIGSAW